MTEPMLLKSDEEMNQRCFNTGYHNTSMLSSILDWGPSATSWWGGAEVKQNCNTPLMTPDNVIVALRLHRTTLLDQNNHRLWIQRKLFITEVTMRQKMRAVSSNHLPSKLPYAGTGRCSFLSMATAAASGGNISPSTALTTNSTSI